MFPTPTSRDHKDTGISVINGTVPVNGLLGRHVQMFPTPKAQNATGPGIHGQGGMDLQTAITRGSDGTDAHPSTPSGSLNPRWVGWLMGFPDGWTNLEP
jgi:DNA (cytosine-5)-methyltransferase 1